MKTKKKYRLTNECIIHEGHILYRIEALKDFGNIKVGTKGGWVESEMNLSHHGLCWVGDNAKVYGNARILWCATVCDNAEVYLNATVYDFAWIYEDAKIYENAKVGGKAKVYGKAKIYGEAVVYEDAIIRDNAKISEYATIFSRATVCGWSKVYGHARVSDFAFVCDNTKIYGKTSVYGHAQICNNAVVHNNEDYIIFKNWWSSGRFFTWTRSNNMWKVGCFYGTGEELIKKAYKDNELSGQEYERIVKYVESIIKKNKL